MSYVLTLYAGPASLQRRTQSMSLFGYSWLNSQQGRPASPPPPFSYLSILFTYAAHTTRNKHTCTSKPLKKRKAQ